MIKNIIVTLLLITTINLSGFGQKLKIDNSLNFLKNVKTIKLEYDYSKMSVGNYENEDEYLNERVAKRNEKEPGAGDKWREDWVNDREARFEPKFEELFNKYIIEKGVTANKNLDEAPITMVVKTVFTEPGFNIGIVRKSAYINVVVEIIDSATDEVKATIIVDKVPGRDAMGYDFDTGYRIQEAYAKLGKEIGKHLIKKVL